MCDPKDNPSKLVQHCPLKEWKLRIQVNSWAQSNCPTGKKVKIKVHELASHLGTTRFSYTQIGESGKAPKLTEIYTGKDEVTRYISAETIDMSWMTADASFRVDLKPGDDKVVTLVLEPTTLELKLELGDVDALFDPITNTAEPAKDVGVQQRLQVLGYLYTPLGHPKINDHAEKCAWYYQDVVHSDSKKALKLALKDEINGNLLASTFPKSGDVLASSKLPKAGELAALRIPGGYCTTKSAGTALRQGDHVFNNSSLSAVDSKYDLPIGGYRHKLEEVTWTENELLGKLPLIATVNRKSHSGRIAPAKDMKVLVQLVDPDPIPAESDFAPADLPNKVMNYSLDGMIWESPNILQKSDMDSLSEEQWKGIHRLVRKAWDDKLDRPQAKLQAETWIDTWEAGAQVLPAWENVSNWWGDQAETPYTPLRANTETVKEKAADLISPPSPQQHPRSRLTPEQFQLLVKLCRVAAVAGGTAKDQIKRAEGWITTWDTGGENPEWSHVENWWGDELNIPYPQVKDAPESKFDVRNVINALNVSKPRAISTEEWGALQRLTNEAKRQKPDASEAKDLAHGWIDIWASATGVVWVAVQDWWGDEENKPYTKLDDSLVSAAKAKVDFLLDDREKAATRVEEIDDAGQKKYVHDLVQAVEDGAPGNPQRFNAPATRGGKCGSGVGAVLEIPTSRRAGFHDKRPDQATDYGALELATIPGDTGTHPHAVQCITNDEGNAGVIFTPSRCGGDRYKFKVYLDPSSLADEDDEAPSPVETGTMIVWRNIRLYRYIQKQTPSEGGYSDPLKKTLSYGNSRPPASGTWKNMYLGSPVTDMALLPGADPEPKMQKIDPVWLENRITERGESKDTAKKSRLRYRPIEIEAATLETELRRAYCELIADCSGIEDLDLDELKEATKHGVKAAELAGKLTTKVNWDELLYCDATSPFMINLRSFDEYNERIEVLKKTDPSADQYKPLIFATHMPMFSGHTMQYLFEAILEQIAKGGVLPGITVIQVPRGSTWDHHALSVCTTITSGYGTASRGLYLSYTKDVYREELYAYAATSNTIHELGHVLGLAHQSVAGTDINDAHQKGLTEPYHTPEDGDVVCVMSYSGCYGDLCGECNLSLRGWNQIHAVPWT